MTLLSTRWRECGLRRVFFQKNFSSHSRHKRVKLAITELCPGLSHTCLHLPQDLKRPLPLKHLLRWGLKLRSGKNPFTQQLFIFSFVRSKLGCLMELLRIITGKNVKWLCCYGKHYGSSSKVKWNNQTEFPWSISTCGFILKEWKAGSQWAICTPMS